MGEDGSDGRKRPAQTSQPTETKNVSADFFLTPPQLLSITTLDTGSGRGTHARHKMPDWIFFNGVGPTATGESTSEPKMPDWVFFNGVGTKAPPRESGEKRVAQQALGSSEQEAPKRAKKKKELPVAFEETLGDQSETLQRYQSPLGDLGVPHPTPLCTPATLEYTKPPVVTKEEAMHLIGHDLLNMQALSDAQVHALALAIHASRHGHAFLVGDATGVGKGRTSMGFIAAHWLASNVRRALVVSAGNLAMDVLRDFNALNVSTLFPGAEFIDASKSLPTELPEQCVIFTTYTQVRAKSPGIYAQALSRGGEYGPLVLDEVHRGAINKNATTFLAVQSLLEKTANCPLLALSATYASNLEGIRLLAPRLGLVGNHQAFRNFDELKKYFKRHNETGLEILTGTLAKKGLFIARSISYHGTTVGHVACTMSPAHLSLYKMASVFFKQLYATGLFTGKKNHSIFCGDQLRFFKSLTLYTKIDDVISATHTELALGRQVVITVLGTDEAALHSTSAEEIEKQGGVSALGRILVRLLDRAYHLDAEGEHARTLSALRSRASLMRLPLCGAIDLLKHRLAESGIVELTGRCSQLVFDETTRSWKEQKLDKDLDKSRSRFQAGESKVAILSGAVSTGISLHDVGDASGASRPRTMILYEIPWSASQTLQMLGRVHRSGQRSSPKFLTTSVTTCEKRFSAAVSHRLKQLGALTSCDQRCTGGVQIPLDGEDVLSAAGNRAVEDFGGELDFPVSNGKQFLNYSLSLAPDKAEHLLKRYFAVVEQEKMRDISQGKIPAPRATLREGDDRVIVTADMTTQGGVRLLTLDLNNNVSYEQICETRETLIAAGASKVKFVVSVAVNFSGLALAHYRDNIKAVRVHFVDGRVASIDPSKLNAYTLTDIETVWTNAYNKSSTQILHLAAIPCFEVMKALHDPPRVYRLTLKSGECTLAVAIDQTMHDTMT